MLTSPELIGGLRDICKDLALSSNGDEDRSRDFVLASRCRSMLLTLLLGKKASLVFWMCGLESDLSMSPDCRRPWPTGTLALAYSTN